MNLSIENLSYLSLFPKMCELCTAKRAVTIQITVLIIGLLVGIALICVYEPKSNDCSDLWDDCKHRCGDLECVCPSCNVICKEPRCTCIGTNSTECTVCPRLEDCDDCIREYNDRDCNQKIRTRNGMIVMTILIGLILIGVVCMLWFRGVLC